MNIVDPARCLSPSGLRKTLRIAASSAWILSYIGRAESLARFVLLIPVLMTRPPLVMTHPTLALRNVDSFAFFFAKLRAFIVIHFYTSTSIQSVIHRTKEERLSQRFIVDSPVVILTV